MRVNSGCIDKAYVVAHEVIGVAGSRSVLNHSQIFHHWLDECADFADTASVISRLDLVISVDTSTAHLVGAMRRRCWLLLPASAAPRWLRDRSDTPWYPQMRLFRQSKGGDWMGVVNGVLAAVADALQIAGDAPRVSSSRIMNNEM